MVILERTTLFFSCSFKCDDVSFAVVVVVQVEYSTLNGWSLETAFCAFSSSLFFVAKEEDGKREGDVKSSCKADVISSLPSGLPNQ